MHAAMGNVTLGELAAQIVAAGRSPDPADAGGSVRRGRMVTRARLGGLSRMTEKIASAISDAPRGLYSPPLLLRKSEVNGSFSDAGPSCPVSASTR
jgi:hypothetical protein